MGVFWTSKVHAQNFLTGGTDFFYVSSDATINPNTAFQPWNSLSAIADGIVNNTSTPYNGVVFEATGHDDWNFSFANPSAVSGIGFWTTVGSQADNGIKGFSVSYFDTGTLLGTQTGNAALGGGWQDFSAGQTFQDVTNATLTITSNYGSANVAEFSEVRFDTPTPLPEPSSLLLLTVGGILVGSMILIRNRNSARASC